MPQQPSTGHGIFYYICEFIKFIGVIVHFICMAWWDGRDTTNVGELELYIYGFIGLIIIIITIARYIENLLKDKNKHSKKVDVKKPTPTITNDVSKPVVTVPSITKDSRSPGISRTIRPIKTPRRIR